MCCLYGTDGDSVPNHPCRVKGDVSTSGVAGVGGGGVVKDKEGYNCSTPIIDDMFHKG